MVTNQKPFGDVMVICHPHRSEWQGLHCLIPNFFVGRIVLYQSLLLPSKLVLFHFYFLRSFGWWNLGRFCKRTIVNLQIKTCSNWFCGSQKPCGTFAPVMQFTQILIETEINMWGKGKARNWPLPWDFLFLFALLGVASSTSTSFLFSFSFW